MGKNILTDLKVLYLKDSKKGFSVIELLVTLIIVSLLIMSIVVTYRTLIRGFIKSSGESRFVLENFIGLELLRLDVEHTGFGISSDETVPIISWDSTNKELKILSTLNNTNQVTRGWVFIEKDNVSARIIIDQREKKIYDKATFTVVRASDKTSVANNNACENPTSDDERFFTLNINSSTLEVVSGFDRPCLEPSGSTSIIYIGFPVDTSLRNFCEKGYCYQTLYYLSDSNLSDRCNIETKNLLRKVADGTGEPIIECVSDFAVNVDLDTNGDGIIDLFDTNLPSSNTEIRQQLKLVNVYLLVQVGNYDPGYTFTSVRSCGANVCINDPLLPPGLDLKLPTSYKHYKWQVLKLRVKPENLK